ncbi:hypothetical protein DFJ73DRAFT_841946 [Zopfochytrium polystomum]|nr:hypothetical protein DFJ73DRAFT_841946 [Zopfochytrium polystomum]
MDQRASDDGWGSSAAAALSASSATGSSGTTASASTAGYFSSNASASSASSSSTAAEKPPLTLASAAGKLKIVISDPQKHGEGTSAFVNYLVTTKTSLPSYSGMDFSVRRRFQDFAALHRSISDEAPSCVIPPLPGKHRMEYITGDRFNPDFIERRRVSLQSYMDRLSRHPTLQLTTSLRKFLDSADSVPESIAKPKDTNVFENLSDTLLNAFTKVKKPDERFTEFKEQLEKLEENITVLERLHSKMIKIEAELELDLLEFGGHISTLGTMETQITGPLTDFGNILRNMCSNLRETINAEDLEYLANIREYIAYCQSVKDLLKLRDQKQIDYEELSNYLQNHIMDRDRTLNPQRGGGGLVSYFNNKFQELKGVDQEKARKEKLEKLAIKIKELEDAVEISNEVSIAFSEEVVREVEFFKVLKLVDWRTYMASYANSQHEYYEKVSSTQSVVFISR